MPASVEATAPVPIRNASRRWSIYAYVGTLVFIIPFTGIANTTVIFLLKDRLGLDSTAVAQFQLIGGIPAYLGFVFGVARDRWNPFGRKDQGILLVFTLAVAVLYAVLAFAPVAYAVLLPLLLIKASCGQMVGAAVRGIISSFGKVHVMSGRMSALWQAAGSLPALAVSITGGYLADHYPSRTTFLLTATISFAVFLFSLWRPSFIFDDPAETEPVHFGKLWSDAKSLLASPGIRPCLALLFLWSFTPGAGTPIQFYITNTLHGTRTQYGYFEALFSWFFVPTYLLHGLLCTRFKLRTLLWASTFVAVPQILPLVLVHDISSALWAAVAMGLMGGFATAAYFDLLIRACPPGLRGTAMMLGSSVWVLANELGNLAGAVIFKQGGFAPCAYATVAVYSCLLPILLLVPRFLTDTRDGEAAA